ncbi:hypothetical protein BDZ97DRAFT_1667613 [Flammula alnicola]|nr:hypothetical protein BDZ97DRAFT_1667613 [Flammula alnicola]
MTTNSTEYVGFDFPRELPGKYGEVALLFEKNDTSYPLTDNDAWNSLVPPELGLTRIGPKGRPFGLAIYHQLHCLNSIRYMYMVARLGLTLDSNVDTSYMHNTHCIHFLRQGLLCHPDLTLIPVNGTQGELHRCRDWSKIRKFVEDNQDEWKGVSLTHAWEDADISVE